MTVTVQMPPGWDAIIRLESVDAVSKTIRSFRGERLPVYGTAEIAPGSLLVLHAGGTRYWPGVTDVVQVTRAGTLITVTDEHGDLRSAGPGRLEAIGRRTYAVLEALRTAQPSSRELDAIRALERVDANRVALVVALAQGSGFQSDRGDAGGFDPEVDA